MKVVIQNRTTGDYVGTSGKWTSDPDRSFDFEKTMLAFQYCRDSNLTEADVIFKFEDPQYDIPFSFDCPVSEQSVADRSSRKLGAVNRFRPNRTNARPTDAH
jgi:hypothetical protein